MRSPFFCTLHKDGRARLIFILRVGFHLEYLPLLLITTTPTLIISSAPPTIGEVNSNLDSHLVYLFISMRAARVVATTLFIRPLLPFPPTSFFSLTNHGTNSVSSVAAMSISGSTSPPIKNGVRVVSYNLLSSKLARPSHFTHAEPDHLEFDYRLRIILDKLDAEMNRSFGGNEDSQHWIPPSIFALQEVCYPFASALHTFFAQRGYHFVTGLYGKQFNGYVMNSFTESL